MSKVARDESASEASWWEAWREKWEALILSGADGFDRATNVESLVSGYELLNIYNTFLAPLRP